MTATKRRITARRERNLELGKRDAANRCTACRRALPKIGALMVLSSSGEPQNFCDDHCQQDYIDALQTMEARR